MIQKYLVFYKLHRFRQVGTRQNVTPGQALTQSKAKSADLVLMGTFFWGGGGVKLIFLLWSVKIILFRKYITF